MHRKPLKSLINQYRQYRDFWQTALDGKSSENHEALDRFENFILTTTNCFQRTHSAGHVTASALVINEDFSEVLLTLHQKLGKWLQLGGHCDGDSDTLNVAMREVFEESGLKDISPLRWSRSEDIIPFDFDIHEIPARPGEEAHYHFDVRYIFIANSTENLVISNESKDLKWVPWKKAFVLTNEISMKRQFYKGMWLGRS